MDDHIEEAADDRSDRAEERADDWQWHIKGAIYRRHDHPKSLYRGSDPLPTSFLSARGQYRRVSEWFGEDLRVNHDPFADVMVRHDMLDDRLCCKSRRRD